MSLLVGKERRIPGLRPKVHGAGDILRTKEHFRFVVLDIVSFIWYHYTFVFQEWYSNNLAILYALCLMPGGVAWGLGLAQAQPKFAPTAIVIMSALAALPVPLFPYSNDEAFYLAKSFWAAQGENFFDPVMGVPTGYPALFHIASGALSRATGLSHVAIGQYSLITASQECWRSAGLCGGNTSIRLTPR